MPTTSRTPSAALAAFVLAVLSAGDASAQEQGLLLGRDPRRGAEFFEAKVRPLLVAHCYSCHSDAKAKPSAGLRLDRPAGWLGGDDGGPAVKPGAPDESPLVRAVRYTDEALQMPPAGKLSDADVAVFEAWVAMGAPGPDGETTTAESASRPSAPSRADAIREAARGHRLFGPLAAAAPPAVRDAAWPRSPLDRFVLAALEREGLAPAPAADRRTWLRRVTFDLVGLPPTPEETAAFLADSAPDAFEKVVERLLASEHYGERWGRRWLDVARYADSNGLDENLALAEAWRYRDWVVKAHNADLPYDRFLTWQIAGDAAPEPPADDTERFDRWTATGFLVLGPKMLAEQDKAKLVFDAVDEQLDVTARAFLGLTVGCARCHDHKFDPISQRDYAALAGVFKSTKTFGDLGFVSRWNSREMANAEALAAREAHRKRTADAEAAVRRAEEAGARAAVETRLDGLARHLVAAGRARSAVLLLEAEAPSRGNLIADPDRWGDEDAVVARTGGAGGTQFAEYDLATPVGGARRLYVRYASAERRPVRVLLDGALVAAEAIAEETGGFHPVHQRWSDVGVVALRAGRNVLRLESAGHFPHVDRLLLVDEAAFAAAAGDVPDRAFVRELATALAAGEAADDPVWRPWRATEGLAAATSRPTAAPVPAALARAFAAEPAPRSAADAAARYAAVFAVVADAWRAAPEKEGRRRLGDDGLDRLARVLFGGAGAVGPAGRVPEALWPEAARATLAGARAEVAAARKAAPPPVPRCLGVEDGKPEDVAIHVRGSHLNPGPDPVPRGFLSHFADAVPFPRIADGESGRLALARWMTDPRHPLTARVAVNRIWQGHFGRGLVPSSSNFGLRGEPAAAPEHAELLDHLAREFMAGGWSRKALHRMIVLSAAYRMSSAPDAKAAEKDPDARLLWRFPRLRLDAEALRDAILAVSGRLDRRTGGPALPIADGEYVTNDQSADAARYGARRRALYLPVVRNAVYDFFATFDFGDPSVTQERRATTVVPGQALWLRNSPFVREEAAAFAAAASAGDAAQDDAAFVARAYRAAFVREPTTAEVARATAYLRGDAGRRPDFCRALFACDEFLYVD